MCADNHPQTTELQHLKRLEGADVRQGAPPPTPSLGPGRGRGASAPSGRGRARRDTVRTARVARGRGLRGPGGLSSPPAGRASGRPGGEGVAPGGALRRRVPEPLMGRARPQPRSRGAGRRKRPCRMEIDLARRRLSRRCGSPVVWLLAPDALSWCRCCSHRVSVKSEFLAKGPCILIGEVMKSKVTGSNFPKLAFIRASPGDYKGRRTRVFKGLHAHNQLLRLFFGEEGGPDSATPSPP